MQMQLTRVRRALLSSLLLVLLAACGAEDPAAPSGAAPASPAPDANANDESPAQVSPAQAVGERLAQPCLSCHEAGLFAGRDADELVAQMQGIAAGDVSHPPLPATLSDEDLAEIAAFLGAQSADAGS